MSGNVVPATGDVQFLSNASSNAVCQVFGLGSNSSFSSLGGRPYNPSVTSAPVFTAPSVPSFPLSLQRDLSGASLFIDTPSNPTIGGLLARQQAIYPFYSGPTGPTLRYYIALGTSSGTSNTISWRDVSINSWNYLPANTFTQDVKYYLSAVLSNIDNGRKSLAISNTDAYGQPLDPTITFTITSRTNWRITWTESSTVTIPTTYYWYVYKSDRSALISSGSVLPNIRSVDGTTALDYNTDYIADVINVYSVASGSVTSSAIQVPALAAPVLTNFTNIPTRNTETVTANWGAVTNASGYRILINDVFIQDITTTSYSIALTSYANAVKTFKVRSKDGSHLGGTSTGLQFFYDASPLIVYKNVTFTSNANYIMRLTGGSGGTAETQTDGTTIKTRISETGPATSGGSGGLATAITKSARTSFHYVIGSSGSYMTGGSPGGGSGANFGASAYSGGGGGYSIIRFDDERKDVVWAGGGGGEGGGGINLGVGATPQKKLASHHAPGAGGGQVGTGYFEQGHGGSAGTIGWYAFKVIDGSLELYARLAEGGQTDRAGVVPTSNVGGAAFVKTGSPSYGYAEYSFPNSFKPTSGSSNTGGNGGKVSWFSGSCGAGGGGGYFGGAGGSAFSMVIWPDANDSNVHKGLVAGGGGGGGSSYVNTDYATITENNAESTSNATGGSVFIAQRV